jgi:hypothetical protein
VEDAEGELPEPDRPWAAFARKVPKSASGNEKRIWDETLGGRDFFMQKNQEPNSKNHWKLALGPWILVL